MEQCSSRFGGVTKVDSDHRMLWGRFLFTEFHPLHGTAVSSIKEHLSGPNRHALILRMHEGDESLNGVGTVLSGEVSDLR